MRVMHLIEPWDRVRNPGGSDAGVLACRAMIDATPEIAHEPILIGSAAARTRARSLGLDVADSIAPAGPAYRVWRHLRSLALARGCPDVIQVWSVSSRQLAIRAAIAPVVSPDDVLDMLPLATVPRATSRARHRQAWGLDETIPVIAALADPPSEVDALRFVLVLGLLEQVGIRAAGLIESAAGGSARACVLAERVDLGQPIIITDQPVLAQLPGVDLAAWIPRGGHPASPWAGDLVADACHGASVPVVRAHPHLPDHARTTPAAAGDAQSMFRALCDALEPPDHLGELADAVRARAASHEADVHGLRIVLARAVRGLGVGDYG